MGILVTTAIFVDLGLQIIQQNQKSGIVHIIRIIHDRIDQTGRRYRCTIRKTSRLTEIQSNRILSILYPSRRTRRQFDIRTHSGRTDHKVALCVRRIRIEIDSEITRVGRSVVQNDHQSIQRRSTRPPSYSSINSATSLPTVSESISLMNTEDVGVVVVCSLAVPAYWSVSVYLLKAPVCL